MDDTAGRVFDLSGLAGNLAEHVVRPNPCRNSRILSKPHGLYYRGYAGRNDGSNGSIKIKKGEADFGKLTPNPNVPLSFLSG